jgi:preprotein translocase subunit YajC
MQFNNEKTRNVADIVAKILAGESAQTQPEMLEEELKGNQHKIDANKNNKVDAHDFKLLRAQKEKEKANSMKFGKNVKEETEEIDEATPTAQQVKQGIGIARDKRYAKGNVTGAVKAMDKVNKGIAQHPVVNKELRKQNEETELTESHFKVGDEVVCKASGMEGEVVKVDPKGEGKYYTVKQEDGTMKKFAPEELKKEEEDEEDEKENMKEATEKEEGKFHSKLDKLVHKTFGKSKEEKKQVDEAMFPGTKEYEKKFGQSPQQKLKKVGDTEKTAQGEMKKTAKGVMHTRRFSEMLETYKDGGLKTIAEMLVKEEPDNEEFTKEVEEVKKKDKGELRNDKGIAKGSVQAVKNEETEIEVINADIANGVEMIDIEERSLTEPEMKKKEEIVKGMKKGMQGFKQRYGERAKEVIYATATARAKGE